MEIEAGSRVLLWARVTNDGRGVVIAPGVELGANTVDVATDVPDFLNPDPPKLLMMFFASDEERDQFCGHVQDVCPAAEARDVPYGDS